MKLGSIIYFIPFFFVLNPALIMQGDPYSIIKVVVTALVGVWLIASGLQGYLAWVGKLDIHPQGKWVVQGLLIAAGLALATPGGGLIPFTNYELGGLTLVLAVPAVIVTLIVNKRRTALMG